MIKLHVIIVIVRGFESVDGINLRIFINDNGDLAGAFDCIAIGLPMFSNRFPIFR